MICKTLQFFVQEIIFFFPKTYKLSVFGSVFFRIESKHYLTCFFPFEI